MIDREDMLELTRRMTVKRTSIDRIAGCYFDEERFVDGTFNRMFLELKAAERDRLLKLARAVPFATTNKNLIEIDFPGETRESGDMMRLLDGMKEVRLQNDALLDTFYDVLSEALPEGRPYAICLFDGAYDIPVKGSDKKEQWESEEVYKYLICVIAPVDGDYEIGEPTAGFLYPSFKDHSTDWDHIAVMEKIPGVSGEKLISVLGCIRD